MSILYILAWRGSECRRELKTLAMASKARILTCSFAVASSGRCCQCGCVDVELMLMMRLTKLEPRKLETAGENAEDRGRQKKRVSSAW